MIELGNTCYIKGSNNLYLIIGVLGDWLKVQTIYKKRKIEKIVNKKDITEIIEN